jgi:hypothetical protein
MGKLVVTKNGEEVLQPSPVNIPVSVTVSIPPPKLNRKAFLSSLDIDKLREIGSFLNVTARTRKSLIKGILNAEDIGNN